jgi:UDP-N-acetylglucosamine--N-acetylmuramyl-(pentapeptide) pyrophosphoryl-undecaprenol N-acetylglucosamine transferase
VKLVLSGGGTGGHVYPALAVAQALRCELGDEQLDLLYIGAGGQELEIVQHAGIAMEKVSAAPIRGRMPWEIAANSARMAAGVRQARHLLGRFQPDVVLSTGGYASFPVALAARSRAIPLGVYLPDLKPGWSVRAIARMARRVAVTAVESVHNLPADKTVVTGYPVRKQFHNANRSEGRSRLGLDQNEKVLFVTGASSGAHSINQAVASSLHGLLQLCEVVHLCGKADEPWLKEARDRLPPDLGARYHVYDYMHDEVPWAMAAADLAVCRAGASVLGELPATGLPAILVPYPYAGAHQRLNARHLECAGAAVVLDDDRLETLLPLAGELLHDDARRDAMRAALRRVRRPDAAARIARILIDLARGEKS